MRIKIFFMLLIAILTVPSPSSARDPDSEDIFQTFTPNGIVAGVWASNGQPVPLHKDVPGTNGCDGRLSSWIRKDHIRLTLAWYDCGSEQIRRLIKEAALLRSQTPAEVKSLSALKGDADFVFLPPADDLLMRVWFQGDLYILIGVHCGALRTSECAALSAPAARALADTLPGTLRDSDTSSLLPPLNGIFRGLILFWLLVVGVRRLGIWWGLERFDMSAGRLHSVDGIAREMRRTRRRRWWGWLLASYGVLIGIDAIKQAVHGESAWDGAVFAVLTLPLGLLLLRTRRHQYMKPARRALHRPELRDLLWPLLLLFLGLFTVAIPVLVLFGWFLAGLIDSEDSLGYIFGAALIAGITLGGFIDRGVLRLRARNAREVMKNDKRPYFLYLRNFGDDAQKIPASRFSRRSLWQKIFGPLSLVQTARFEEVFTKALSRYGPIIAVGPPDTNLRGLFSVLAPQLGASRARLPHDAWQRQVHQWAAEAGAVVVSATPQQINPGFAWELEMLAQDLPHGRVVLICGPGDKQSLHRAFGAFMGEVGQYELFRGLTTGWLTDGVLILVHVPSSSGGVWHGWGAERRTAWTYTAAVNAAMEFAQLNWTFPEAAPSSSAVPSPVAGGKGREQLLSVPVTEVVRRALDSAAANAKRKRIVLGTSSLLLALMAADSTGEWSRLWLHCGDPETIEANSRVDQNVLSMETWQGVSLTDACARALRTASKIAEDYNLTSVSPGVLALALITDRTTGASLALGIDSAERQRSLADLIQDDLLGVRLPGLAFSQEEQ